MDITTFLNYLDKVRKTGDKYQAVCPSHDDKSPSLSIKQGDDGRILVHCHAGCTAREITESLGLRVRDLFTDTRPIKSSTGLSRTQLENSLEKECLILLIGINKRQDFIEISTDDRVRERQAAMRICKLTRELYV